MDINYKWKPQFQEDYLHNNSEVTRHEIQNLYTRLSDSHIIDGSTITQCTNILLDANTKCRTVCTSSSKSKFTKLQMLHCTTQNAKSYVRSLLLLKMDIKRQIINESRNTYGRCCRIKKAKHATTVSIEM